MSPLQILSMVLLGIFAVSFISHTLVTGREGRRWEAVLKSWKKTSFTPEEARSDIQYFQNLYERVHPAPYHVFSKTELDRLFSELRQNIDQAVSRPELFCRLAAVVSQFKDEHTQVRMPSVELNELLGEPEKAFPYQVQIFADRCFLTAGSAKSRDLPAGTEILAINQIMMPEIIRNVSSLFWGTSAQQRSFYAQQSFAEALYLFYGFQDRFELKLRTPGGELSERWVTGREYQVESKPPFSYKISGDTLLFDFHDFEDPEGNFSTFLKEMFIEAQQKSVTRLVIDLRENQGGTSSYGDRLLNYLTDKPFSQFSLVEIQSSPEVRRFFLSFLPPFLHWFFPLTYLHPLLGKLWRTRYGQLAEVHFKPFQPTVEPLRFSGQIFVLIGPGSMSSASLLAAVVKADRIGKLVGEPAGGSPTHYGNMLDFHLPATGLKVLIPASINHGSVTGSLLPDEPVSQTLEDLAKGKDTVLEWVLNSSS